jgi:uncharacterized protein YycO
MNRKFICCLIYVVSVAVMHAANLEDGDIVFQSSKSQQSAAIAAATRSEYTHVGIVFMADSKPYVYEAVQPVKRTSLDEWIKRGTGERFVVKRLKDRAGIDFTAIHKQAQSFLGKNYDFEFRWSDEKFYCSELVWKAYQRASKLEIGSLKSLREFDLSSRIVREKLRERYGATVPYDMQVISPACIFSSELLMTVPQSPK